MMNEAAAEMKGLRKERAAKEPSASTVFGKFDPDDFDAHEDAFLNLLAQSFGVLKEPLRYIVVRPAEKPTEFISQEEERMYQFPLEGGSFELDNQTVHRKLKAFLINASGWAWIEPHDMAEKGRNAYYLAWIANYIGEGELSKKERMARIAKAKLENLHYKKERSMIFERCTEIMTRKWCFNTLHMDPGQRYSYQRMVENF
jgi:hypothetical protein